MHFFLKYIWSYQKKAVPLHREIKKPNQVFYILTIRFCSQITFIYKQQNLCHYENSKRIKRKM